MSCNQDAFGERGCSGDIQLRVSLLSASNDILTSREFFAHLRLQVCRQAKFSIQSSATFVSSRLCKVELSVLQTTREKTKLFDRVRRVRGKVEAIERALEQEIGCADVLHLITAARGAVNALIGEVIEDRIRIQIDATPQPADAAQELIDVLKSYLK